MKRNESLVVMPSGERIILDVVPKALRDRIRPMPFAVWKLRPISMIAAKGATKEGRPSRSPLPIQGANIPEGAVG